MKQKYLVLLLALGIALGLGDGTRAIARAEATATYDVTLDLDPSHSRFRAQVEVRGATCTDRLTFLLNRTIEIEGLSVDGRAVQPQIDETGTLGSKDVRTFSVPCPIRLLKVDYRGMGALSTDGRNQVSPELVELSLYGAWYPLLKYKFTYRVNLELDEKAVLAANGLITRTALTQGKVAYTVTSLRPVNDIALVSSPSFIRVPVSGPGVRVEALVRPTLPPQAQQQAREAAADAQRAATLFQEWFGSPDGNGAAISASVAFSPRPGPLSYARLPLIVVYEAELTPSRPPAEDDRYLSLTVSHEVGHFWWSLAEYTPADDWLNEGLAEYSAALFIREVYGKEKYVALLKQYGKIAAGNGQAPAIVRTPSDSRWTYLNRYVKPVLLLDAVEQSVGSAKVRTFLKALHRTALSRGRLTTEDVLAVARTELGAHQLRHIMRCLNAQGWPTECSVPATPASRD